MKPLLKWVGGKRWLLPVLEQWWAAHKECKLIEPVTGGMAVTLGLNPKNALLNDANEHLINFYQQVRKGLIIEIPLQNSKKFYYQQRTKFNALIAAQEHKT